MLVPVFLNELTELLGGSIPGLVSKLPALENAVFGLVIILFLLLEPRGLARIWQRMKDYIRFWPFRY
jgi:branched-chain amino acid transport system permease protein